MSGYPSYLIHYGIQGQKWGVRRFQNEDGTLTPEGIRRYGKLLDGSERSDKYKKKLAKFESKIDISGTRTRSYGKSDYASRKDIIRYNRRFDNKSNEDRWKLATEASGRRQQGKDPSNYVKKYAEMSYETASKLVNGDTSEAAQKIMQHYVNMSMSGLNYELWETGDFNSHNDHPTKYNQIDYSYDVKKRKVSQKKWKSDWT